MWSSMDPSSNERTIAPIIATCCSLAACACASRRLATTRAISAAWSPRTTVKLYSAPPCAKACVVHSRPTGSSPAPHAAEAILSV